MKKKILLSLPALILLALPRPAPAETITQFLRAFHKNPARVMGRLPSVVDRKGRAHPQGYINYRALGASFDYRNELRAQITGVTEPPVADPEEEKDHVEKLVEPGVAVERNLPALEKFMALSAPVKPWADSYWPTYRGQIATRYGDPTFPKIKNWASNFSYAQSNPASMVVSSGDLSRINLLSPAEKYDFVLGDAEWTMTNYAWSRGRKAIEGFGVATWMGICHGWAAASSMGAPFIEKPVTVLSQSGVPVTFYPQDIKALQSMLWANGSPVSRFISRRCTVSRPSRNAYGRVIDPNCFDTNPATWHLAVTNQLGKNGRGFVFDGTYDAEVWNFPIASTQYRYFNPRTMEETVGWKAATIPLTEYNTDKFREFRSSHARSVVGIYMDVTYVIEIEPGIKRVYDAPTKTVRYIYDLELDENNSIVGGEWYSNAHPDFVWTFDTTAQAMARDENVLLEDPWNNQNPVPLHWTAYARKASARGIPLYAFIKKIVESGGPVHQP
ncbi:MAG TPA: hypothetical protein VIH99_06115 [Bdellovibrionota bacterium]|jgi:hypothetical protein